MAVFNPGTPSLAPNYGGVADQLEQRATMESKRPRWEDAATQIVTRLDQEFTKERDFERKMKGDGRVAFTSDMATELAQQLKLPPAAFSKAVNRYFSQDEMEKLVTNVLSNQGMGDLKENVDQEGGLTTEQYNRLLATGEPGKAALAANTFPKPVSGGGGRKTVRLEDPDGKIREIPIEVVSATTDWDTFSWDKFPLAGYKPTTTKNPQTGEVINVTASGKTRGITGPAGKPEGAKLRNDYDQLNAKEKERVDKASKEVMDDPVVKDIRGTNSKLGALRALIQENLPQGVGIVQSRVARFLGSESGALAEGDVTRASGSQAWENQINAYRNKALGKGLTDEDVKGFLQLLSTVQASSNKVLNQTIDQHIYRVKGKGMEDVDNSVFKKTMGISAPAGAEPSVVGRRKATP